MHSLWLGKYSRVLRTRSRVLRTRSRVLRTRSRRLLDMVRSHACAPFGHVATSTPCLLAEAVSGSEGRRPAVALAESETLRVRGVSPPVKDSHQCIDYIRSWGAW